MKNGGLLISRRGGTLPRCVENKQYHHINGFNKHTNDNPHFMNVRLTLIPEAL